jgi:hypothetical protein
VDFLFIETLIADHTDISIVQVQDDLSAAETATTTTCIPSFRGSCCEKATATTARVMFGSRKVAIGIMFAEPMHLSQ